MPFWHRPFCAFYFLFYPSKPDDKKERSMQIKARPALNQVSEMLSFVF